MPIRASRFLSEPAYRSDHLDSSAETEESFTLTMSARCRTKGLVRQFDVAHNSFEQDCHLGAIRYQSALCHVQKQAVFYNPYNITNKCGQRIGILDFAALTIKNYVSFVSDKLRASFQPSDCRADSLIHKFSRHHGRCSGDHFNREWNLSEAGDDFTGVGNDDESL